MYVSEAVICNDSLPQRSVRAVPMVHIKQNMLTRVATLQELSKSVSKNHGKTCSLLNHPAYSFQLNQNRSPDGVS